MNFDPQRRLPAGSGIVWSVVISLGLWSAIIVVVFALLAVLA